MKTILLLIVFLTVNIPDWAYGIPKGFKRVLQKSIVGEQDYESKFQNLQKRLDNSASSFLQQLDAEVKKIHNEDAEASWAFATNITDYNKQKKVESSLKYSKWNKNAEKSASVWKDLAPSLTNSNHQRQLDQWARPSTLDLSEEELERQTQIVSDMAGVYSTAKVCNDVDCDLSLDPDLTLIFKNNRNPSTLKKMWLAWRHASGAKIKKKYEEYVHLSNKGARGQGYADAGEMWRAAYESDTLVEDVKRLTEEMSPLYKQLHAYVRRKLREVYGSSTVSRKGPIPAHLLGNMWSQSWGNIFELVAPYPDSPSIDVSDEMVKQKYTERRMFEMADEFFASLGMEKVNEKFWNNSLIKKPEGRDIVCHASAWDFSTGDDFRIKQCTGIDMEDFITVHHEMGHIQYYMQYKDQPYIFQNGANPGFHEAVGDVIALSVSTPKHLHKVGLLKDPSRTKEADINYLMSIALDKLPITIWAHDVDSWRWDVFNETTSLQNMNCHWWKKRFENEGIKPPNVRSNDEFDAGAKMHVANSIPYIRYFIANILQFQLHEHLCLRADEYDANDPNKPLHHCDVYQSKEAGKAFIDLLKPGSSKPAADILENLTGNRQLTSKSMVEYFKPLHDWLRADNEKHGEFIGWEKDGEYCSTSSTRSELRKFECTYVRTRDGVICL